MDRFGIIHISDTQFGSKHVFGNPTSKLARLIADDVTALAERHVFTPLYVLLSGDITETAHFNEFALAQEQVTTLATALSLEQRRSILCVPGNHDVSWPLAKAGRDTGNPGLALANYDTFVRDTVHSSLATGKHYPVIADHRFGVKFLLVNSCEKEDEATHIGYVDEAKLLATLERDERGHDTQAYLKVCVLHHRLDTAAPGAPPQVQNAAQVEALLVAHGYAVVLSGHAHQGLSHVVVKQGLPVIYSGCGSTGVDHTQRPDGVPNQYSIHVIDRRDKIFETYWRAFNPQRRSRMGLGGWTKDSQATGECTSFPLPAAQLFVDAKQDIVFDAALRDRLGLLSNPFLYSNAEKIAEGLVLDLFVTDESRHKGAMRLSGDAIIRGPRGSGKTMFLRYLYAFGSIMFRKALQERRTAECLPVMVNLSRIHRADLSTPLDAYSAAERLIYESVLSELRAAAAGRSPELKAAVHRMEERLVVHGGETPISRLGRAIQETLNIHFKHVLLLIDELAPVFPKSFFSDQQSGFVAWMNSIRNSGPYCTRVTVYPNDFADILNEERFGTNVNLEYQVRVADEYEQFRSYSCKIVNQYLASVSVDKSDPVTIKSLVFTEEMSSDDALEQLIYASDGSSRRLLSLLDRCLNRRVLAAGPLSKDEVFAVIREMANNLLTGYAATDRDIAASIAKACKKQSTFRFRMPNQSVMLRALHGSREEFNILKLVDARPGARGLTYEFAYPYCIAQDIQTHYMRDTSRVCTSRDRVLGEWINRTTTVDREALDVFSRQERLHGAVADLDADWALIDAGDGRTYVADRDDLGLSVGDRVTFLVNSDGVAFDILVLEPTAKA